MRRLRAPNGEPLPAPIQPLIKQPPNVMAELAHLRSRRFDLISDMERVERSYAACVVIVKGRQILLTLCWGAVLSAIALIWMRGGLHFVPSFSLTALLLCVPVALNIWYVTPAVYTRRATSNMVRTLENEILDVNGAIARLYDNNGHFT